MVVHTKDTKIGYLVEDLYASGKGATKYLATPLAAGDVALLTAMSRPQGSIKLPVIQYDREVIRGAGMAASSVEVFYKGYKYKEIKITQFVQSATWLTESSRGGAGAIMENSATNGYSYLIHFEIPGVNGAMDYFDAVGCTLEAYEYDDPGGNGWPKEVLTFRCYDVIDSVAVTNMLAYVATQPSICSDAGLTLDADPIVDLQKMNFKVENVFMDDNSPAGKLQRFDPILSSKKITVDATAFTDTAALQGDPTNSTLNKFTIIVNTGQDTFQATEMYVEDDNMGEIPEYGLYEHRLLISNGGTVVVSIT